MDQRIQAQVENALAKIQHLFDANKSVLLHDQDHAYFDKYTVTQFAADQTISELDIVMKQFNSTYRREKPLNTLFVCTIEESCVFKLKQEKKVALMNLITEKTAGIFKTSNQKEVSEIVMEYVWDFVVKFKLFWKVGDSEVVMQQGEIKKELKTSSDINPRKDFGVAFKRFECNPYEYLEYSSIGSAGKKFHINRQDPKCYTPRRNPEIINLVSCCNRIQSFCNDILGFFDTVHKDLLLQDFNLTNVLQDMNISSTVLPIMTQQPITEPLKKHFAQNVQSNLDSILSKYKEQSHVPLAKLLILNEHLKATVTNFNSSVDYIESLLRKQLVDAIGKEISIKDMEEYMVYHNRQILQNEYHPKPISIDVRRAGYTPEGSVQIEVERGSDSNLLFSVTREIQDAPAVTFDLNASTEITLKGTHYIHASIAQKYSTEQLPLYNMYSRARQFSSFILLVGNMIENSKFEMKHAMIISNKDDLKIPLLFETIPTAQEFRDAIKSLSPNQQRFAKSIRAMQMQSTLFAFCIVQIKPQLENILNLPSGSLTKEIKLTQDLLKLFIEFQIPSDMMKFDGDMTLNVKSKIELVKGYTNNVMDMIKGSKDEEFEASMKLAKLQKEEKLASEGFMAESYAPPVMMSGPPMPMMMSMAPMMSRSSGMPHPAPPPAAFAAPAPGGSAPAPVPAPQVKTRTPPTNAVNAAPINEQSPPNYSEGQVETDTSILKYTNIPTTLESSFDVQNCGSIRPTIIKLGPLFTKKSQAGLIKSPVTNFLNSVDQKSERNKALDLLDALSRSGELVMDESTIHVVVVSTQCFDETLINQVIQKDCNPIDLIERSTLIMAKTLHGKPVQELLVQSALPKVKEISPCLFD